MTATPAGAVQGKFRGRALVMLAVAIVGSTVITACSSDDEAETTPVSLVIKDQSLRVEGDPCAGIIPLQYLHAGAPYVIKDSAGTSVATGKLPEGVAIPGTELDFGDGAVVTPTFCLMEMTVPGRIDPTDLSLFVDDEKGIKLTTASDDGSVIAVIPPDDAAVPVPTEGLPQGSDSATTTEDGS